MPRSAGVELLQSPATIRARCERLLALGEAGELPHFAVHLDRLDAVADRVEAVTRECYPDLQIPYHSRWRHFDVGGVPRLAAFDTRLAELDPREQGRVRFDLVVTSVLLDAGAGPAWSYREGDQTYARSEGLAVASLRLFESGVLSSDPARPLQADAAGLSALTAARLGEAFQVSPQNPLVGLEGRSELLRSLGAALAADPARFGTPGRIGGLFDRLSAAAEAGQLPAARVLQEVLQGLGPIWPGRVELDGVNLGDVWHHPSLGDLGDAEGADLVPFHKLSQWLSYSLLEPLEQSGLSVVDLDDLTGLPEYRNGGLLLDLGALELKDPSARERAHRPGDPLIVEWRALTVALLDRVAVKVRERLGVSAAEFPLAKVLQGGTWTTGRRVAKELREGGGPPLRLESDGTVF
ncbi:MAG: URC4/urg3 family protein [Planctomycetes bacterium]|nr:URC4/urg3 family protein [Planctomycetota bacterium]